MNYVVGFLFSPDYKEVVLINKTKPSWQAGRLNGVGGKVEKGETMRDAMSREFEEETGLKIPEWDWTRFGSMMGSEWFMDLYTATSGFVSEVKTTTEERVDLYKSDWEGLRDPNISISNLGYLIPLAMDVLRNPRSPKNVRFSY